MEKMDPCRTRAFGARRRRFAPIPGSRQAGGKLATVFGAFLMSKSRKLKNPSDVSN